MGLIPVSFVLMSAEALAVAVSVDTGSAIEVSTSVRQTSDGPVVIYSARIELTDPSVEIVVTDPIPHDDEGPDSVLKSASDWAKTSGTVLAVNANYFSKVAAVSKVVTNKAAASVTPSKTRGAGDAEVLGLSISDGFVVSPVREFGGLPDPTIVFAKDGSAKIGRYGFNDLAGVWDAVAGIGASASSDSDGGLLLEDGVNTAASARVEPSRRHPRTGLGVSRDGRVLWVVVADGRQPGRSVGLTLPELAEIFRELGADDALNLDGGGSSSFIYTPEKGEAVHNTPSDGVFRPVANHLGVRLRKKVEEPQGAGSASPPASTEPASK